MFQPIRYVGLDVSKETIAVAVAEPDGTVVEYGDIPNDPSSVRRLVEKLSRDAQLKTAYEAGPTGYPLHRQLTGLGIENRRCATWSELETTPAPRGCGPSTIWASSCSARVSARRRGWAEHGLPGTRPGSTP